MSDNVKKTIWLLGTGPMGVEYGKVLQSLQVPFEVIGRGAESATKFEAVTGIAPRIGGLSDFLRNPAEIPLYAIVAVSVEQLASVAEQLLDAGVKKILLEKPGALTVSELESVVHKAEQKQAEVFIAYNRRFYSSVMKAEELIREDGGVTSFQFEFTEWSHVIEGLKKAPGVKEQWFYVNSTHVIDMAFFLGGKPKQLQSFTAGGTRWHQSASVFAGAGISENGALFSYHANWEAPGRWGLELLTKKHRFILRPLEKLQVQNIGSVTQEFVVIDDSLDVQFKPGVYREVSAFLHGENTRLSSVRDQLKSYTYFEMINPQQSKHK